MEEIKMSYLEYKRLGSMTYNQKERESRAVYTKYIAAKTTLFDALQNAHKNGYIQSSYADELVERIQTIKETPEFVCPDERGRTWNLITLKSDLEGRLFEELLKTFQSIAPGESYTLDEIIGEGERCH